MADLNLRPVELMGNLKGGKVKVNGAEAWSVTPSDRAVQRGSGDVPTPPAAPLQPQPTVWIVNSFNKTVRRARSTSSRSAWQCRGSRARRCIGMVMPSSANPGHDQSHPGQRRE